ncbi:MAG: VanZ family protein [Gemmatimonadota bacterium]
MTPGRTALQPLSHARIGLALFGYLLGVTLIITLLPFRFSRPESWRIMLSGSPLDVAANVLLFLPLGFLFRLSTLHATRHAALPILAGGALLSMAIECAQLFEAERFTSPIDVATNAAGAWLGALACDRTMGRLTDGKVLVGRLSLELPLMGLLYLTIPLLWLNALGASASEERAGAALLIAAFGATVAGGLQRHHFGPFAGIPRLRAAVLVSLWFVAGAVPMLNRHPLWVAAGAAVASLVLLSVARRRLTAGEADRRYEVPVLISALPAFAAYLITLAALPLVEGVDGWRLGFAFPGVASEWTRVSILRLLEMVAAFTLLGYICAELRGRIHGSFMAAMRFVGSVVGSSAVANELLLGFHGGHGASVMRLALLAGAGTYGAWLYHLQRTHVTALLASRESPAV